MSDELIQVSIDETPIEVTVSSGTHEITVTEEGEAGKVITISADPPQIVTVDERPVINVFPGSGSHFTQSALIDTLNGALDVGQFSTELAANINLLGDLWVKVGNDIEELLIEADRDVIIATSQTYTDTEISSVAVEIARVDDDITANTSSINQTATNITTRVDSLELSTNDSFTAQSARIDTNATGITLASTRMDGIDGDITATQASLAVESGRITAEVVARQALADGQVETNRSNQVLTADSLTTTITNQSLIEGRVSTAEVDITAFGVRTTVLEQTRYSLEAVQTLTSNSFGVSITEDTGSNQLYVTGFELVLAPTWNTGPPGTGYRYDVDDQVKYTDNKVYKCLVDHLAAANNAPDGVDGPTYWAEEHATTQSEFNVRADSFSVIDPGGGTPIEVFNVSGGVVSINADLVLSGSLESDTYAAQDPDVSWYKLDHTTGSAVFNNMIMTFNTSSKTTAQTALNVSDGADNTKTIIDGGLVTTGTVQGTGTTPALIINFNTGAMTVNSGTGLVVNSVNGITLNSGGTGLLVSGGAGISVSDNANITVSAGGELFLNSTASDIAHIVLQYTGTATGYINSISGGMGIIGANNTLHDLNVYNFKDITLTATTDAFINAVDVNISGSTYVENKVGSHTVKMIGGLEIHTGLLAQTSAVALASSQATALAIGDFFFYSPTDDFRVPSMIYRNSAGTLISARIP